VAATRAEFEAAVAAYWGARDDLYDAVCYLVSSPADPTPVEPVVALDWRHFAAAIQARITYLAALGFPGPWASQA
jgi:hypothetical protein